MTIAIAPADYVQIKLFCALTGYTPDAVDKKMRTGVWREGKHYRRAPDGHILLHLPSYYAWAENQPQAA
jgi:hypothetical protein